MKTMPPYTTGWLIAAIGTAACQSMLPVLPSSASRNPAVVPGTGDGIAWLGGAPERTCDAIYPLGKDRPNVIAPPHAAKAIAIRPNANTRFAAVTVVPESSRRAEVVEDRKHAAGIATSWLQAKPRVQ